MRTRAVGKSDTRHFSRSKVCKRCGVPISIRSKRGLCYDCWLDAYGGRTGKYRRKGVRREMGVCILCKRKRLVPYGKDRRYFRCDTCNRYLEQEGFFSGDSFASRANIHIPSYGAWG